MNLDVVHWLFLVHRFCYALRKATRLSLPKHLKDWTWLSTNMCLFAVDWHNVTVTEVFFLLHYSSLILNDAFVIIHFVLLIKCQKITWLIRCPHYSFYCIYLLLRLVCGPGCPFSNPLSLDGFSSSPLEPIFDTISAHLYLGA